MNRLSTERRCAVVQCLVKGNSIRATTRITGAAEDTIAKLVVELGEACLDYHDEHVRDIESKFIQCDEIWSFVRCKQQNLSSQEKERFGLGDVWTRMAMHPRAKLMVSWSIDAPDARAARDFVRYLQSRLANRVQLTTDGFKVYLEAVEDALAWDIDDAMLVKLYGEDPESERRHSPAECVATRATTVVGSPDRHHVSTSFIERQNLTMRMGIRCFTRLTNALSKNVENHACAVALHFMHYNFARPH